MRCYIKNKFNEQCRLSKPSLNSAILYLKPYIHLYVLVDSQSAVMHSVGPVVIANASIYFGEFCQKIGNTNNIFIRDLCLSGPVHYKLYRGWCQSHMNIYVGRLGENSMQRGARIAMNTQHCARK